MRAIIADDQIAIRRALRLLLEEVPAAQVVGEATDLNALGDLFTSAMPDLVLLDWELPPGNAAAAVAGLRGQFPQVRFIVLSTSPEAANDALAAGAEAFVSKGDAPEGLARLLRDLSRPPDDRNE
jgi:DNA-binding NarL/FixJ family response regulator